MVFPLSMPGPGSEVTEFAVIPVVRQPHLRPDEEYFLIVNDDPAVVVYVLVDYRPVTRSTGETQRTGGRGTNIPMSQTTSSASSDASIFARTSHECNTVSPGRERCHHAQLPQRRMIGPSKK